jgi:predicted ATPase/DNA-binding transcriptional LysR family regulator
MDLEARLRAFAAVAREGSFSRAAERLYVSQPAISKHVASLEAELGAQLVVRDRRGASLTPAGELLADYVLRAEALLANGRRALAAGGDAQVGTLALAASGIPGTYLLPAVLARFHEQHPAVELDFRLSTSGGALDLVRAHEVELALVGGMTVPPELESEPLVDDEVVLVGPSSLAGRRLRAKDLSGLTWISREEGSATREAVESARWQIGLRSVRVLELPSWESVKLAVASGAGIAAISRFALDSELETGALAILDVPRWRLQRTIAVLTARDVPLTPPAERFLGLLREAFSTAAPAPAPNSNLPVLSSRLVGREPDLRAIQKLMRDGARLLTVTGPGGSGKTRLALEAAAGLFDDFPDGVYLVSLAPIVEPELVLPAVARTLGIGDAGRLEERLAGRRLLLVLDNLEQVADAGLDLARLLDGLPELRVLGTSRRLLRVTLEHEYPLEPLELGDAERLFVERARAVRRSFEPDESLRRLCERLDCLPLALELAAARVRTLPPAALAERLEHVLPLLVGGPRDLPRRQQTLRATIEWSADLLEEPERSLFVRLAAFGGSWALADAEAVCEADGPALESLVDQGLLRHEAADGDPRYSMLETIREFAVEQLELDPDRDVLRRRHAQHFLALARAAQPFARGPQEQEWLDRLVLDLDNIRSALRYSAERPEVELGLELAATLEPLWVRGERHREGLRWFEPLLGSSARVPASVRGRALGVAARLALELGDVARAKEWHRAALRIARKEGDQARTAWALHGLGHVAWEEGKLAQAWRHFEESLELFVELGEHGPAGGRLTFLAAIAREQGDLAAAHGFLERSREHYAEAGDIAGVSSATQGLGDSALDEGDYRRALERYAEALEIQEQVESRRLDAYILAGIAACSARLGRPADAARLWGAVERIDDELDYGIGDYDRGVYERVLGEVDPADLASGRELSDEEALALGRELSRASGS